MDSEPTVNSDPRRILPSVDRLIREVQEMTLGLPEWAISRTARAERCVPKILAGKGFNER